MNTEIRNRLAWIAALAAALFLGAVVVGPLVNWPAPMTAEGADEEGETVMNAMAKTPENVKEAIFAGGCFWCIESAFELMPGVIEAVSGYTGGDVKNPTYEQVSSGATGHVEAVRVRYDPAEISYGELLEQFWRSIDPTDDGGQFYDRGSQYDTAIFYTTEEQGVQAEASKRALEASGVFDRPIVTRILPAQRFWMAEEYHQDYFAKYLAQYKAYSSASGRDAFLDGTWAGRADVTLATVPGRPWNDFVKLSEEELRERLTPLQYSVTQENGTEMPFVGESWDNEREGIYVDVVSGEPLFSSLDKHDFGTGWPSFTQPIAPDSVVTRADESLGMERIEVRSRIADSHLGHLFDDSPLPGGLRYCVNSAALRFIPKEEMAEAGYAEYLALFE